MCALQPPFPFMSSIGIHKLKEHRETREWISSRAGRQNPASRVLEVLVRESEPCVSVLKVRCQSNVASADNSRSLPIFKVAVIDIDRLQALQQRLRADDVECDIHP